MSSLEFALIKDKDITVTADIQTVISLIVDNIQQGLNSQELLTKKPLFGPFKFTREDITAIVDVAIKNAFDVTERMLKVRRIP